jgi:hypothetical protein
MAGAGLPAGVRLAVSGCDKFSFFFASTYAVSSTEFQRRFNSFLNSHGHMAGKQIQAYGEKVAKSDGSQA